MGDSLRVNGVQYGWDSLIFKIDGDRYNGLKAIEYGDAVEKALQWGMGKSHAPRSRTRGKYTPEPIALTVFSDTAKSIRNYLAQRANGTGIAQVEVPIVIQAAEAQGVITVEFERCTLVSNKNSHDESPEALEEKLEFLPMNILRDGVALFDTTQLAGA